MTVSHTDPSSDQIGPEPVGGATPLMKVTSDKTSDAKVISVCLTNLMENALKPEEIAKHVSDQVVEKVSADVLDSVGEEVYTYLKTHRGDLVDRIVEKVAFALSTRLLESMGPTGPK